MRIFTLKGKKFNLSSNKQVYQLSQETYMSAVTIVFAVIYMTVAGTFGNIGGTVGDNAKQPTATVQNKTNN